MKKKLIALTLAMTALTMVAGAEDYTLRAGDQLKHHRHSGYRYQLEHTERDRVTLPRASGWEGLLSTCRGNRCERYDRR